MAADPLAVTWRPARSTRGPIPGFRPEVDRSQRPGPDVKLHAVRNGHTLCGFAITSVEWADGETGAQCEECRRVPVGHVTHREIMFYGITYRQLDYWARNGYLRAANPDCGSGTNRYFPASELAIARFMAIVTSAGVSPAAARKAARNGGWLAENVQLVITGDSAHRSEGN